jgi:hypothetical protein
MSVSSRESILSSPVDLRERIQRIDSAPLSAAWPAATGQDRGVDACSELVALAERLAARNDDPRRFVSALAAEAGGIRPGVLGFVDLARGGRNRLSGEGFRRKFDDGTEGQARHFAGICAATLRLGPRAARVLAVRVLRDDPASADGRLTDAAIRFTTNVVDGTLPIEETGPWIRRTICGAG